ncbi:hypothetical protein [Streptomyces sp. NPDC021212]|uniref:hypothetical protein n=1 Tax=Streptomyces sp. NPDC021212 TaxID=3365118 RepID=UPI00379E96AD
MNSVLPIRKGVPKCLVLMSAFTIAITLFGCSGMRDNKKDDLGYTPKGREVSRAKNDAKEASSEILEIIDLRGEVSEPGPGIAQCGGKDPEKFYRVNHMWSLSGVPVPEMQRAMTRLKEGLPKKGWKIAKYGPDGSRSKSPELVAVSVPRQFSVNIHLYDESKKTEPNAPKSLIYVFLTSDCFQVPEGGTVGDS